MNLEVYRVFEITSKFRELYYEENNNMILRHFALIGASEFNIPLVVLNKLAITCKYLFLITEWRILLSKALYNKWIGPLGRALYLRAISHPFTYSNDIVRVTPVSEMGFGTIGLRVLDIEGLFDQSLNMKRIAFTDISFITHDKTPLCLLIFVKSRHIYTLQITSDDYIDLGEFSPDALKLYENRVIPGRYLLGLNLPTRYNPIVLGYPFIPMNRISFCIGRSVTYTYVDNVEYSDILFDVNHVADNFTHAIINFKTVDEDAYDWSKYQFEFIDNLNGITNTSFIREIG